MAEKELPERMGIAETRIDNLTERMETLEKARKDYQERREKNLMEGLWLCIKLMAMTTLLTVATPKVRDGVAKIWSYFFP